MSVVADTGPFLAAIDQRDAAHGLAAALVSQLGRDLLIPTSVIAEVDHLVRTRLGSVAARRFLSDVARGVHAVAPITGPLVRQAVAIDARHADLELGWVDSTVMAVAEQVSAPILTFDFADFRAASSPSGRPWNLIIDEARYREATTGR